MSYASRALVATAFVLIAAIAGAHFRWFLPCAASRGCHTVLSIFLLLEILLLYTLAATSDPGYVVSGSHSTAAEDGDKDEDDDEKIPVLAMASSAVRYCVKCAAEKPRRAHHCRVCGRCVREMDHHCVWLNNCVGAGNYRFFWLLLLYLWVSCAYVAAFALEPFRETLEARRRRAAGLAPTPELALRLCNTLVIFSFLLTSALAVVLGGYWAWHVYLVLTQQTTIRFLAAGRQRREDLAQREAAEVNPKPKPLGRQRLTHLLQRLLGRDDRVWFLAFVIPTMASLPRSSESKRWRAIA